MGNFSAILASLRDWWQSATPVTRAAATGLAIFVVFGLCIAGYMATSPDYTPIYNGVSGKDAAAIESALRDKGIQMRFDNGTVSVPSKDESNAIMYVEANGILSKDSSVEGIEQLDKIAMGTSTDVEQQRILAADEGELARKLMDLDPVSTAAVTISPGSNTDLFTQATPPTASVILGLKSGNQLNDMQVRGIVNLVAHAVSGLTPQNITLTDQTGTPLWKDDGQGGNAIGDGEPLSEGEKYAETKRKQIQTMLDETLGPRKAVVTVNAELDFDQTQTHTINHTPVTGVSGGALPISVREKDESYSGGAAGMAGGGAPAGTGSNLTVPSYSSGGADSKNGGTYKTSDSTTNYADPNLEDTITQKAPGTVRLLTVAALVDTSVPASEAADLKNIIAADISATAGDAARSVTVEQIKFDNSQEKAAEDQMKSLASQEQMEEWTKIGLIALGVCFLLYMLTRTSAGAFGVRRVDEPRLAMVGGGTNIGLLEDIPEATLEPLLQEDRPLRVEDVLAEMPEVMPRRTRRRPSAPSIEEQHDLKMESIQEMIATNSEAVALLLKGWMAEETKFIGG